MGGEPTVYGLSQNHKPLLALINEAKKMEYEYVRIDTNGIFESKLLSMNDFKKLDEITFSLDGHNPELNDPIRGNGTFRICVSNIKMAVELGYDVNVTCCLHKELIAKGKDGVLPLDSMVYFVSSLGVKRINFHDLFKSGLPRDTWTGNFDPSVEEWMRIYAEINANIALGKYNIPVRIPQCFITQEEFGRDPKYYGYCPAKMGERVLVHPDGIIRICSLMIGTPYGVARFYDKKIVWDYSMTNELRDHDLETPTPCTNQNKNRRSGSLVPLCVSFKPRQDEFIWREKINWESKKQL
jgi:MoaA/NifB/PqqE/SkfB family radical SAM enzyme